MVGSKIQLLMRDVTTGKEKLVMYNVNSVEQSAESPLKSLLKVEAETVAKETFSLSKDMEPYDSLKPVHCFETKRPKSAKRVKPKSEQYAVLRSNGSRLRTSARVRSNAANKQVLSFPQTYSLYGKAAS